MFREQDTNRKFQQGAGSAVAKKWSFLTMKETWSQFSSLGQSHNGLILEYGLVFMPWMLGSILCGAAVGLSAQPQRRPRKFLALQRGFQMLIMPRLEAQLSSQGLVSWLSLSLSLAKPSNQVRMKIRVPS